MAFETNIENPIRARHPVLELIRSRQKHISDEHTLALAVEGGGMRGTLTAAMLAEMESSGISPDIFDLMVGTSAGVTNCAGYISGNINHAVRIYPDYLNQLGFVRWRRAFFGGPIISMSILLERIMETEVPMDWRKIVDSKKLYSVVADPRTLASTVLGPPENKADAVQQMYATTHIAALAGRPRLYNGIAFYDGSLVAPLPVQEAVGLGASHVLALSSRELGKWRNSQNTYERVVAKLYNRWFPGLDEMLREGMTTRMQEQEELIDNNLSPERPPYVLTIDSKKASLSPIERDKQKIEKAIKIGRAAVRQAFSEV